MQVLELEKFWNLQSFVICIVLSVCSNTSFSIVVFVLFYPTPRNALSVCSSVTFFTPSEITAPIVSGCSQLRQLPLPG